MPDLAPVTIEGTAPTTLAPVAAPEEVPQAAPVTPQAGKVAIRDPDGSVSLIRSEDLAAAQQEGARPATETEYYGARTGKAGQAMSALTGVGRGLSFGAFDPLTIEADRLLEGDKGAEEMRHELNMLREANPNASLGGEIAGSLAGMFVLPGGAGAEAVGEGMLARGASRLAGMAPRAFLEGAGMGAGQQLSEDALGDHDMVGENYVAAGLKGGLINLLVGGGLHVAGGAAKDALSAFGGVTRAAESSTTKTLAGVSGKDIDALAERQFGFAPDGLGEKVRKQLVRISAGLSGRDEAILDKFSRVSPEARELRRIAVFDSEKELLGATSAFRSAGDDMLRANKLTMSEFQGSLKAEKIAKAVATGNEAEVAAYAQQQIARAIDIAEGELRHADGVAPQAVKSLESIARSAYHAQSELATAIEKGGEGLNAKAFMALDSIKRDTQRWVNGGYGALGKIADPFDARLAQRSVQALDGFQGGLIKGLEDNTLFGKAADIQKAINADWTMQIDASKRFNQALTTDVGRDPTNPFRQMKGIDPAKADSYARGLTNPNADLTHQAVKDYVSSTESLAKTLRDNVELPPAQMAEVEKVIAASGKFRGAVDKAEHVLTATNQFKQLTERNSDGFATLMGMVGLSTGPLGAAAGLGLGTLANPGRAVAQMAALERMGVKLDEKLEGGISNFLSGKSAGKVAETKSVSSDAIRALRDGASSRAALMDRVSTALDGLGESTPKVARAAASTIMRASLYVSMSSPKDPPRGGITPFVTEAPRPFKASELAKAQAAVEVLQDPTSVIDALNEGRLSREHVEALKFIYPKIYERTQRMVRQLASEGTPKLSIQKEVGLSILFATPINAMMQPQNIRGFQAAFAQGADPLQGGEASGPTGPSRPLGKSRGTLATEFDRQEAPA